MLKTEDNTRQNEPDCRLSFLPEKNLTLALRLEKCVKITSLSPLHHQIVMFVVSESTVESSDKGRLGLLENSFFEGQILLQLFLFDKLFLHLFYCIGILLPIVEVTLEIPQEHLPKSTFSNCIQKNKVI